MAESCVCEDTECRTCLGCGYIYRAIQYNSVNEDDMWKGFVNLVNLKENSQLDTINPPIWVDARNRFSHLKTKKSCASALIG